MKVQLTVLALCAVFFVAIQAQSVSQPSDCYAVKDAATCVATNSERPINSSAVHCLWCHSHGKGGKGHSHCASHRHIKHIKEYHHNNWVCDYRMPTVAHHRHGKYPHLNRTQGGRHGRRLLDDGSNQITQFIENEVVNWTPAEQVLAGIVYGALGNLPQDLNTCLQDAEHLWSELDNTYSNWEWTFSLSVILPELESVYDEIGDVLTTVKDCSQALSDAESDVKKVLSIIKGSTGFIGWLVEAGEIAFNSVNIYQDVSDAIDNWNARKYFDSGYNIGAIVYILI
jgi:hypothetical protein